MPGGPELIIILVVVLVLFGGSQLPKLAKNLGKAQKEFKEGMGEGQDGATPAATAATPPPAAATPPPPPPPADETK
jgi:sec-independent protein translocase protein TatA